MLGKIVAASIRLRTLVLLAAGALLVIGVSQVRRTPADVLPEFGSPTVEVQTESLGLSPIEVEQLISVPMEQEMLNGIKGVRSITSDSISGLSSVDLTFEPGTSVQEARQLVQEKLTASALPNVAQPPQMVQPVSSTPRVMMVGVSSATQSPTELSVLARWVLRPRLMGIPGVANVAIWGLRDRQLQVLVDPRRVHARGLTLSQIVSTAGNAQLVSPLTFLDASTPGTGGFIDGPNQRLSVMHVLPFASPANLAQVPVEESGGVRLGDVATVTDGHQPLIGDAIVDGRPGLLLAIDKRPGASAPAVTHAVERALDDLRPGLAGVRLDSSVFRPASYVASARHNLTLLAAVAAALLLLVLAGVLRGWRTVLIAAVSVALSLVTALLVLKLLGYSANALVVVGLMAALAVVVDDALGDTRHIGRRVREGNGSGPTLPAALASVELRRPLAYATAIALLAAVPVLVANGPSASFVHPAAFTYVLAVLASMIVALAVTPALSVLLRARAPVDPPLIRALARATERFAARIASAPRAVFIAAGVAGVVALAVVPFLSSPARPSFRDRDVVVSMQAAPGTSLEEMDRVAARTAAALRSLPGVSNVGADVGRAVLSDRIVGPNSSELWVSIKPGASYDSTLAAIRGAVAIPGVAATVSTYEADRGAGVFAPLANALDVRVYGQDYSVLAARAGELARRIGALRGVRAPRVEGLPVEQPTLQVAVDLAAAQRHGLKPGDVRRSVATLVSGLTVGNFFEQQQVFDVVVRGAPATQQSVASVSNLLIDAPGGAVPLSAVAHVSVVPGPLDVRHDAVSRYVDVRAALAGTSAASMRRAVERQIRAVSFPLGYHAELHGSPVAGGTSRAAFASYAVAAEIGILLLLQAAFGSWLLAGAVLVSVPFALAGGLAVAFATGSDASIGAIAGLVALLVLFVRHATVFVVRCRESESAGPVAVRRAARAQLAPLLASMLAVAAVTLPFAVAGDVAGNELAHQLAAVVLGGLVSASLVAAVVVPALYARLRPPAPRRLEPQLTFDSEQVASATH